MVSGLPLVKNFTYQGTEVHSGNFSHYSKGEVQLSTVPLWFKITYRFSSGKDVKKIEHPSAAPEQEKRKGF
jgi:hypothetical protein